MKKRIGALLLAMGMLLTLVLSGCGAGVADQVKDLLSGAINNAIGGAENEGQDRDKGEGTGSDAEEFTTLVRSLRAKFLENRDPLYDASLKPSVSPYLTAADVSSVINLDQFNLDGVTLQMLLKNGFVVTQNYDEEFYQEYEDNRYRYVPNFVTTDAMMHTYHLYFSHLLKGLEKEYFSQTLSELSVLMRDQSMAQLKELKGTAWENAARRNAAFFAVGAALMDPGVGVPTEAADVTLQEMDLIQGAGGPALSPIMNLGLADSNVYEDYSQYIPRGYYTDTEALSRYFRAMMWYGRMTFLNSQEDHIRSALLMTVGLEDANATGLWDSIYTITSFFVGASDDPGVYEYAYLIRQAYGGELPAIAKLPELNREWTAFRASLSQLKMPAINSIPILETDDLDEAVTGFRFMGQRFTMDAAIFQQLVYRQVGANSSGATRMLPSALDVPAALGSGLARDILRESGADDYAGYRQNMEKLQSYLTDAPDALWESSLYGGWMRTLLPLTQAKGEGWPQFMQNEAWAAKSLNTFLGSWTELKHDTVLYAKQVYAEMGGGDDPATRDDRGYVEPEPELFGRLSALSRATAEGLARYGVLQDNDRESLDRMAQLSQKLMVISEKELREELPTDEEFELIRSFGGTLEHFWYEALRADEEDDWFNASDHPAAVVTDVATDPNGWVLEVGTGHVDRIVVLVNVGGSLRLASGSVYSFYEFEQPLSERLTDRQWRIMMGIGYCVDENGNWVDGRVDVPRPAWTSLFRAPDRQW